MKQLILTRGVSGSGKSFLAKQLKEKYMNDGLTCHIFSTDDYWYIGNGDKYIFDFSKIGVAHRWNQKRVKNAMHNCENVVIVDNTNTTWKEIKNYIDMALTHNYSVKTVEPSTAWKYNVDECFEKNSHGVPRETIQRMLDRFVDNETICKQIEERMKC